MPWAQDISLDGRPGPFENLLPVANYTSQPIGLSLARIPFGRPIPECIQRDPFPLPATDDREGYHDQRHYEHWLSGLGDHANILHRLFGHDIALAPGDRVLDFGCASGRVLRHFHCQSEGLELWGTDINHRNVEFVRRFLAPSLKVFQCSVLPHLPLEDDSTALVYAFSVFTHIDKGELAWLNELRRILRPGGVAYLTLHTDHTWRIMKPTLPIYSILMSLRRELPELKLCPEMFQRPMPAERFVVAAKTGSVYNVNIFHTIDYIRSTWGRFLEVLEVYPEGHDYQDVVLLRKH